MNISPINCNTRNSKNDVAFGMNSITIKKSAEDFCPIIQKKLSDLIKMGDDNTNLVFEAGKHENWLSASVERKLTKEKKVIPGISFIRKNIEGRKIETEVQNPNRIISMVQTILDALDK